MKKWYNVREAVIEMKTINETFKTNLKLLLEKKSATQKDLADYLGIHPASVNVWIRGRGLPEMSKIAYTLQNKKRYF